MTQQQHDTAWRDGDKAHLTVQATYADHAWHIVAGTGAGQVVWIPDDSERIVLVERALPDTEGALVIADVDCGGTCMLRLQDVAPPFGAPGEPPAPDLKWVIAGTTLVIETVRICPGWVAIDPATKRPAGVTR